jgi:hypothetical protein
MQLGRWNCVLHIALSPQLSRRRQGSRQTWETQALSNGHSSSCVHSGFASVTVNAQFRKLDSETFICEYRIQHSEPLPLKQPVNGSPTNPLGHRHWARWRWTKHSASREQGFATRHGLTQRWFRQLCVSLQPESDVHSGAFVGAKLQECIHIIMIFFSKNIDLLQIIELTQSAFNSCISDVSREA